MATELVGIQLELMGADGVKRDLQNLDKLLDSFRGKKKFDAGFNEAKNQVVQYRGELEKLRREQSKLEKGSDEWNEKASEIENVKNKLRDAQQAVREFGRASQQAGKTFKQTFNSISSSVAHVGSAMQSLGNAMTRMTSPFTRLTTGLLYGAGYKALNLFTEGLSNTFERADTMKNYDRTLRALGLDVEKTFSVAGKEAKTAKENLDDAVQGLPTSLDEIMAAQKIYAGATGEMVNSTKTAIAANNTVLASGMGARESRFMQRYLVALSSGAKLTTVQWQSMARIAPLAMRQVSKELGYADKDYKQFTKDVQNGTISGQQFLKAFQKVGTSGAVAAAARAQTESWSGLFANIRIAVTRLGANVIETLNQTFKDATGRTLLQQLLGWDAEGNDLGDGIKGWINGISESIQNWIKTNPDKIIDFFNQLKSIDWKGLIKGFAEGMMWFARMMGAFAKWASNKDLEKIGRWFPKINLLGRGLTILGGFLKGTRHIWALLGAGFMKLAGGKLGKIGIFGKIASIFGKKKDIVDAGKAAGEVPTVAGTFKRAFSALEGLIKAAGAVLIVGTTGMIAFKEVKEMLKDLKDIGDILKGMTWVDAAVGAGIALSITVLTKVFEAIGEAIGPKGLLYEAIAGVSAVLVGGTLWGMTAEIKGMFKEIKGAVSAFMDISNELSNFQAPDLDMKGIIKTILRINEIYSFLSGESLPQRGAVGSAGKVLGFIRNPLQSLGNGIIGGGKKALVAKEAASRYKAVLSAIKNLKSIANQLNELSAIEVSDNAISNVEKIADATNQVLGKMRLWMQKSKGLKYLLTNTENFADTLIQLRRMAYHINALAGTNVNSGGFATFISQLKDALSEMKNIQGDLELDIEVKLKKNFDKSVNNVLEKIRKAKEKIKRQAKNGMSFTIPVQVRFSVTTNLSSALTLISSAVNSINRARVRAERSGGGQSTTPVRRAMGGAVYRAKGGEIGFPGRPRGTDRIPVWASEGEYIHNKRAVNTFGIDFMRKVNSLDVKGAMNELMHRAGGMANVNRGTVITNNTYNNQKVNITNNGNPSAGFTFKSASRFVGAF